MWQDHSRCKWPSGEATRYYTFDDDAATLAAARADITGFVDFSLPNFAILGYDSRMSTMNISLPDSLKDFVDEQVNERGYGTSSEYVRELIRKDQDRLQLRRLLLVGAASAPTKPVDGAYFDNLRRKVKAAKRGAAR